MRSIKIDMKKKNYNKKTKENIVDYVIHGAMGVG
jgi:hypothetical protein